MPISSQLFTLEQLQTPEGVRSLNGILSHLARTSAGDGNELKIYNGVGEPEGTVQASIGSVYLRSDGGEGTAVYIKESGTDGSGWVGIGSQEETKHIRLTIINPFSIYDISNLICLVPELDGSIIISQIRVTLDSSSYNIAADLKYADTFIGLANPAVIHVLDTSSGVLDTTSISNGSVSAGKAIYISFDSQPDVNIKQIAIDISFEEV